MFNRSGAKAAPGSNENCHILLDFVAGVNLTGNVMTAGRDDGGTGTLSPAYGVIYRGLEHAIIKDNTWHNGLTEVFLVDQGDHAGEIIIKDNPGCSCEPHYDEPQSPPL